MTTTLAQPVPWGDRTELLPKRMAYVVSLDVKANAIGNYLQLEPDTDASEGFRHLFDDTVVTMPEGLRCDLPTGVVVGGAGEIGTPADPESTSLRLRVTLKVADNVTLDVEGLGVINLDGGPMALCAEGVNTVSGRAFVATRNEVVSATYRWLYRRQLFGVGTVTGTRNAESGRWGLTFSFDFYAAA